MHVRERVVTSVVVLTASSVLMKLWAGTLSDNETPLTKIIEAAEASRVKGEAQKSSNHVAYALGMCNAARIFMVDSEIERLTGVHMPSYEERLNSLLYQYARSRRKSKL
tara:strand:- start:1084 stop:1410 length:327 start_codon:yes stop_codon:yes gene_type:complete